MRKPKVTYTTQSVINIHIKGEEVKHFPEELPCWPDDGGLVHKFLNFLIDKDIFSIGGMPSSVGGGEYFGFFTAENAKKIEAWLLKQGVEKKNK